LPGNYEAIKRWRLAHPEEARRIGREWQRKRRIRLGLPVRSITSTTERAVYSRRKKAEIKEAEAKIKDKILEVRNKIKMKAIK
jgi:hypothetical protein